MYFLTQLLKEFYALWELGALLDTTIKLGSVPLS